MSYEEHPKRYFWASFCICRRDYEPIDDQQMGDFMIEIAQVAEKYGYSAAGGASRKSDDEEILDLRAEIEKREEEIRRLKGGRYS